MRRSTALVVVAVLLVGLADSQVDWETVDTRGLANVNGVRVDITGWARDTVQGTLQSLGAGCAGVLQALPGSEAGVAALALDAAPRLKGDPKGLVAALRAGSKPIRDETCGVTAGGRRNNDAGYGLLSATKVIAEARREASR